jgi:5-methylcytosine-specific restriction enzyme subunit McrC
MQGVKLTQIGMSDFNRLQLTRNDQDYFLPITICSMIQRLEMPTESTGDHALVALMRDEITFHNLFERFVCNFYRCKLEPEYKVHYQQQLAWPDDLKNQYAPAMRTDITLEKRDTKARTIIDTKYSIATLVANQRGTEKIKSGDLYQLYAYLRTQEDKGLEYRNASGMLIYPTTGHDIHERMQVQGHLMRIETLNLADPWEDIEKKLCGFVGI